MTTTESHEVRLSAADRFFIGGEWVKPSTRAESEGVDPNTGEVVFLTSARVCPSEAIAVRK
jgi:hypothetical protein